MSRKKRKIVKFSSESIKGLPFYLRFSIIFGFFFATFVLFFVLAILIFFGILLFQDKIDIKGYSFEKYKHFLPIGKLGGYDVCFDNIVFSKSKKSFSHSAFGISNLAFKNNYIDLKVKQADFQIAPLEILSRNVLQSISPVKDLYLKISFLFLMIIYLKKLINFVIIYIWNF